MAIIDLTNVLYESVEPTADLPYVLRVHLVGHGFVHRAVPVIGAVGDQPLDAVIVDQTLDAASGFLRPCHQQARWSESATSTPASPTPSSPSPRSRTREVPTMTTLRGKLNPDPKRSLDGYRITATVDLPVLGDDGQTTTVAVGADVAADGGVVVELPERRTGDVRVVASAPDGTQSARRRSPRPISASPSSSPSPPSTRSRSSRPTSRGSGAASG